MAPTERHSPRDRDKNNMLVKHGHTFSDTEHHRRSLVPMWDSADPDRAPPPLPLNPGSNSPVTRPNASATIQAAAAAIAEKSHNNLPSAYTTNPMPPRLPPSPEKSLIKGQYHKRTQSFQTPITSREFASYLERKSPEKNSRTDRNASSDNEGEKSPSAHRYSTPSPSSRDSAARPSSRYLSKPILGETTPPSAAMLALQNMQVPMELELPSSNALKNATNTTKSQPQSQPTTTASLTTSTRSQDIESLSQQIVSLTNIATALQQEMAQLSRRSKDNATDLISLKAATNARDEDIRKSLKELASSLTTKFSELEASASKSSSPYMHSGSGAYMLDSNSSPSSRKSYTLPRIPSPNSFVAAMDREYAGTPAPIATDGSASIALLEKVLREMATKEGQEKLLKLVEDVKSRPVEKGADEAMTKMLEEILDLVKENSGSRALVRSRQGPAPTGGQARPLSHASATEPDQQEVANPQPNPLNEEIMNILKRVKNSVAEGGGLTNEVKALVRELRGEVLGMGRDIARKLEEVEVNRLQDSEGPRGPQKEEIEQIVQSGLEQLRQQLEHAIEESRRKLPAPLPPLTNDDVYAVVKQAISEIPPPAPQVVGSGLEKDEILDAMREAWEAYKPEIELQNFGLERDEILECLAEGLKEYRPQKDESAEPPATYEQVLDAVSHGLQNWTPPQVEPDLSTIREAVMNAVQDCLENFEWPPPPPLPEGVSRDDVLSAVREGLESQEKQQPVELDFNREDVYEAVRAGFIEAASNLDNQFGEQVIEQFHGLAAEMKEEFKQHSTASGKDTEQVLDAIKDGLETLRVAIESYVDRAHDVTGKDEIIDTVKNGFGLLHADVEKCISEVSRSHAPETVELLDAMEKEFEHLRQTLSNLLIRNSVSSDKDEILDAIRDITESDKFKNGNSELEKMVKEEFEHLRETLSMTIMKPSDSTDKEEIIAALKEGFDNMIEDYNRRRDGNESVISNTSELLDAFHDGVDALRADLDKILNKPVDTGPHEELVDSLKQGLSDIRAEIERLRKAHQEADELQSTRGRELILASEQSINNDIESLKVLVTQLQIKIEAIDPQPPAPEPDPNAAKKDDLLEILEAIKEVQGVVAEVLARETPVPELPEGIARKEDMDTIETLVRNTKTQLDDFMLLEEENKITPESIQALEALAKETKDLIEGFTAHVDSESPTKADVVNIENIMKDVWVAVDELKTSITSDENAADKVVKGDVKNLQDLLFEIKAQLEEFVFPDPEKLPSKDDVAAIVGLVNDFREKMEMENELTAQAFEARKVEHGGLAEKIEEAKAFITDLRDELKNRFGDSEESLVDLKTMIESLNESVSSMPKVESIKELSELISREFERSHGDREAAKIETEERELGMMVKLEEGRATAVADVVAKIEEKFGEVLAKYEEAQLLLESNFSEVAERDKEKLEALTSTRALVEDIKLVIGGMGNSVIEACERMGDDARTFFDRVDTNFTKVDELHSDVKTHHEHVKEQFQKTLEMTGRLETQMAGAHPEILNAIKELVTLVGQHYEHSQRTAEEFKNDLSAIPSAIPPLLPPPPEPTMPLLPDIPEKYDDTHVVEKLNALLDYASKHEKYDDSPIQEKLNELLEHVTSVEKYDDSYVQQKLDSLLHFANRHEKYDDSPVREKLDMLLDQVARAEKYDDSHVVEKLSALLEYASKHEKYDDSPVQEKLDMLLDQVINAEKYDDSHVIDKLTALLEYASKHDDSPVQEKLDMLLDQVINAEKYDDSHVVDKLTALLEYASKHDDSRVLEKLDMLLDQVTMTKYDDSRVVEKLTALLEYVSKQEKYDDSPVQEKLDMLLDQIINAQKYDDSHVLEKLSVLLEYVSKHEKYDDSPVQAKLNELLEHVTSVEKYDDSQVQGKLDVVLEKVENAGQKYDDSPVQAKLNELLEHVTSVEKYDDSQVQGKLDVVLEKVENAGQKYDDTPVQDKLDFLMDQISATKESLSQMQKLQLIQEQVEATAREVSEMMAAQSKLVAENQENKRKEAEEIAIALERRMAQREKVEGEIVALNEERDELLETIRTLKREKEELARQNAEMAKELARTETALRIRREEVEMMEERAERIERRIVEDVLDHAKAMLIRKSNGGGPDASSGMKRVPSTASTATRGSMTGTMRDGNTLSSSVSMALKRQTKLRKNNTGANASSTHRGTGRRILSHSHVTGNKRPIDRQTLSTTDLKRSHSVKSNYGPLRKASWEPPFLAANKENEVVKEEDEEDVKDRGIDDGRDAVAPDDMSYVAESELSAPTDRRMSYSSTSALVSAAPSSWMEEYENREAAEDTQSEMKSELLSVRDEDSLVQGEQALEDDDEEEEDSEESEATETQGAVDDGTFVNDHHDIHSDSGLGSELLTASEKGSTVASTVG
ncbi:hypothetical protein VTO42DRAFT_2082 [Malbranchea cinnamomea]